MSEVVPVIDLTPWVSGGSAEARNVVVDAVRSACEKYGFMVISGHGVEQGIISSMWRVTHEFFNSSIDNKEAISMRDGDAYGYRGLPKELEPTRSNAEGRQKPGDLNESFAVALGPAIGRHESMPTDRWPVAPLDFTAATTEFYRAMERLAEVILRVIALGLGIDEGFFVEKQRQHWSALSMLNYPHISSSTPVAPGQLRITPHTDYGTVTILQANNSPGGSLQVQTQDGEWRDVEFVEDSYVVNLGDLMQRWTNDRYKSTMHRVIVPQLPPGSEHVDTRRTSIAFFHNLDRDAICETISTCVDAEHPAKYAPINAWDHLMERHASFAGHEKRTA